MSTAIQFYTARHGDCSVAAVADVFKMKPADVVIAVNYHPWMYLEGPTDDFSKLMIEHDGE